jgi:hypothetical protein
MSRRRVMACLALAVVFALAGYGWVSAEPAKVIKITPDDYVQIMQLYSSYPQMLDLREGALPSIFTEDGEMTSGVAAGHANDPRVPKKGTQQLATMGGRFRGARHFTASVKITPMADYVKGSCYILVYNIKVNPPTLSETSIFDDIIVKTPQGWKFKKRVSWRDDDDISPYKYTGPPPGARGGQGGPGSPGQGQPPQAQPQGR